MIIYQNDYTKVSLESPVSLLISSVPRDILLEPEELLLWADRVMAVDGVILIDIPRRPKYENALKAISRKAEWTEQWNIMLSDFYHEGNHQLLTCFSKYPVSEPPEIPYRIFSEREMQHQCEFDTILIEFLIRTFSEEGDIVLDPFCGTGTVPRTARDLNRIGVGIDKRCPYSNEL